MKRNELNLTAYTVTDTTGYALMCNTGQGLYVKIEGRPGPPGTTEAAALVSWLPLCYPVLN